MDRESLIRRLEAAAYVAREAGMTEEEILHIVRLGIANADAAAPKGPAAYEEYAARFRRAA